MLDPEQFFTFDASENRAIAQLVPAINGALETGRPATVTVGPTWMTNAQLVALGIRICKQSKSNVAVLGSQGRGVSFVPLAIRSGAARTQLGRPALRDAGRTAPPPYRPHLAAAAGSLHI